MSFSEVSCQNTLRDLRHATQSMIERKVPWDDQVLIEEYADRSFWWLDNFNYFLDGFPEHLKLDFLDAYGKFLIALKDFELYRHQMHTENAVNQNPYLNSKKPSGD